MTETLTAERLADIRTREQAATAGPWTAAEDLTVEADAGVIAALDWHAESEEELAAYQADTAFIAAARQDVPDLLDEVTRLRTAVVTARAAVLEEVIGLALREQANPEALLKRLRDEYAEAVS